MNQLSQLIDIAKKNNASDLHLESSFQPVIRIRGRLKPIGSVIKSEQLLSMAKDLLGPDRWNIFLNKRSFDLSKSISGVRCRINVFQSYRGVSFSIRLLSATVNTLKSCNLHPCLKNFIQSETGLIIVSGPTGCGKSTTLSAFIEEINSTRSAHIITIENPIEYTFTPKKAFIRQREVGLSTPSFEQALLDSMREDPDVLVVGEMRSPETMRLTLNAAETGHLVFATMHSASSAEAINRLSSSFPHETHRACMAQLADCLIGVICQKLYYLKDHKILVPVCEVLVANNGIRAVIRMAETSKILSLLQTSAQDGCWTFDRYQRWAEEQKQWVMPKKITYCVSDDEQLQSAIIEPQAIASKPSQKTYFSTQDNTDIVEIEPFDEDLEAVIREIETKKIKK